MDIIIKDHAILQYLNQRSTLVPGCLDKYVLHQFEVIVHHPGKEIALGSHGQFSRKKRIFNGTVGRGFCYTSFWGCRGVLSFGQSVDLIVEKQYIDIQVSSEQVNKMVSANGHANRRRR